MEDRSKRINLRMNSKASSIFKEMKGVSFNVEEKCKACVPMQYICQREMIEYAHVPSAILDTKLGFVS